MDQRPPKSFLMSSRIKYFVVSTSTCLTVLLLIGTVIGRSASPDDTYKHIGVFSDVVARIKSEYVEEPDMKSVTLGALNGMLEAIDPFASYLNADQYKDYLKNKDAQDRKSTRLNSSHMSISYAVFCLKKKK